MAKGKRIRSTNKNKAKNERTKASKPKSRRKVTTTLSNVGTNDPMHIVEYDDKTGEVVRDEPVSFQELIELCRGGVLPQDVIEAAERRIYGVKPKKEEIDPSVEDFEKKYIWDHERKDWRRRTTWDPEPPKQLTFRDDAFWDPVSKETEDEVDIVPWKADGTNDNWEVDLIKEHGGAMSMMTAEAAKKFASEKTGLPEPVVDMLGKKIKPPENPQEHDIQPKHAVRIMTDEGVDYPELYLRVFLEADSAIEEGMFIRLFSQAFCVRANHPLEADVVVFGGGSDVDPQLYGASRHTTTFFDPGRDSTDIALYKTCMDAGVPMIGVCRGAQFLHVMQGGKLFQDVDNHYGPHAMWDDKNKTMLKRVSSSHHQMCIYQEGMDIVGIAHASKVRARDNLVREIKRGTGVEHADIEAFFYRDPCIFGVQGHPEYHGYPEYAVWFLKKIDEFITTNPDIDWVQGDDGDFYRRVKQEFVLESKAMKELPPAPKREILRLPGPKQENK